MNNKLNWKLQIILLMTVLIGFSSCKKEDDDDSSTDGDPNTSLKKAVIKNYADIVLANYTDALEDAKSLNTALSDFVSTPNESNLSKAKDAWFDARESYGTTEAFRFYAGPIDDEDGPEGLLNAWPLDESFIDYVDGNTSAGIINDPTTYPTLSKTLLESLNEAQGVPENVAIGYHAIEFLLWGQDLTAPSLMQAGQRPVTDYTSESNATRRGDYLKICGELLIDHLQLLIDAWSEGSNNYRSDFLALSTNEALKNIFTGIGVLSKSELAGERIYTAYVNRAQEDEHSCFSDNTHRDIILNALGVLNIYKGQYTKGKNDVTQFFGASLSELVDRYDSKLNDEINNKLNEVYGKTKAIEDPFDYAIDNDSYRPAVLECVNSLRDLGDLFSEAGSKMGLTINTAIPE